MRKYITAIILLANIFIVTFLVQATVLAFISQFKIEYLSIALIISLLIMSFFIKKIFHDMRVLPSVTIASGIVCCLVVTLLIFFPHDTLGGSDEAVYSNYGIHLAQTGSLTFSPYLNKLPDKRIENVELYPPGYIVWIATEQVILGFQGVLRSNIILVILGLFSLFLVTYLIGGRSGALTTIILYSSSMPFLWFSRQTMSENLAFFLLWTLILFLFITLKTKRLTYLLMVFFCSWLLALTRLEGILLQLIFVLIIPFALWSYKVTHPKKILLLTGLFLLVVVSNLFITKLKFGTFLTQSIASVNYYIKRSTASFLPQKVSQINRSLNIAPKKYTPTLYDRIPVFFAQMLIKYNFFLIIVSIFFLAGKFIFSLKQQFQTKLLFLIIFVSLLPEYIKLISPSISIFEPWIYRRYIYALLPFGYLSFCILLKYITEKKIFLFILGSLLIINIALTSPIMFVKNNWIIADRINEIIKNVSKNDFILIENGIFGDYYPISFLVVNKNIRSAVISQIKSENFVPNKKTVSEIPYEKIFLLSTNKKESYPLFNIISNKSINIEYNQLVPSCQLRLLGESIGMSDPYNIGILPLQNAINYCSKPGNIIVNRKETLYLYELVYEGI